MSTIPNPPSSFTLPAGYGAAEVRALEQWFADRRTAGQQRGADDFAGSCVACMTGTDTGLGVVGEFEAHVAFLVALGIKQDDAEHTVRAGMNGDVGAEGETRRSVYRLCSSCAASRKLPAPTLLASGADVPTIRIGD